MTERFKLGSKIQIAILALFIVFMPLGSWYYLQSGFKYHKKLMSDLKDYGKIPTFELVTQHGDTLKNEDIKGKFIVATFSNPGNASTPAATDYARRMLEQFGSQKDLLFLFHSLKPTAHSDSFLRSFSIKEKLMDDRAIFSDGR